MLTIPESVLERFRAFSLYNSPYRAHDDGSAIDLYPELDGTAGVQSVARSIPRAPSPVAGDVVAIERVRAPQKSYAPDHDYLVAIDTGAVDAGPDYRTGDGTAPIARILHVDPTGETGGAAGDDAGGGGSVSGSDDASGGDGVSGGEDAGGSDDPSGGYGATVGNGVDVGDRVTVGDPLGEPIRAGFFAPWVDRHLHLGFRRPGDDLLRASGSPPVTVDVDVEPVTWGGSGTVVETAETYAVLDRPRHPAPGQRFASIAATIGDRDSAGSTARRVSLDGGLPHYEHGGILAGDRGDAAAQIAVLGERVGAATGRTVEWDDPTVTVDGTPIEGISLAATRDELGAKLVCPNLDLSPGDEVNVAIV